MGAGTFQKVLRLWLKKERSRRQDQAPKAPGDCGMGRGVFPSQADYRVWESAVSSSRGVGAEPRPTTHFLPFYVVKRCLWR